MVNLQVSSLSLSFGDRVILSDVSFSLSEKSRIALMGANGSGKSTLLKAISHNIEAESMNISLTKGARISYLPQSDIVPEGSSVYDAAEHGFDRFLPKVKELERLEKADASMKTAEGIATLHEELEEGLRNLEQHGNEADFIISYEPPARMIEFIDIGKTSRNHINTYLDKVLDTAKFKMWYFGKRHINKLIPPRYRCIFDAVDVADDTRLPKQKKQKPEKVKKEKPEKKSKKDKNAGEED